MGGTRGGAGAFLRMGQYSSSKSSPKRSSSLIYDDGLRYSREGPVGQEG